MRAVSRNEYVEANGIFFPGVIVVFKQDKRWFRVGRVSAIDNTDPSNGLVTVDGAVYPVTRHPGKIRPLYDLPRSQWPKHIPAPLDSEFLRKADERPRFVGQVLSLPSDNLPSILASVDQINTAWDQTLAWVVGFRDDEVLLAFVCQPSSRQVLLVATLDEVEDW